MPMNHVMYSIHAYLYICETLYIYIYILGYSQKKGGCFMAFDAGQSIAEPQLLWRDSILNIS